MPGNYRIYFIGVNGRFVDVHAMVECASDQEAIEISKQLAAGRDFELWNRSRFIARFSDDGGPSTT
jgi:hypothetical protein